MRPPAAGRGLPVPPLAMSPAVNRVHQAAVSRFEQGRQGKWKRFRLSCFPNLDSTHQARPFTASAVAFAPWSAQRFPVQIRRRTALALCVAAAGLAAAGCASRPRVDWSTRVGTFTFDDAVREMGPPDRSADLSDGGRVAEWLTRRGDPGSSGFTARPIGPSRYRQWGSPGTVWVPATPATPDQFLRLTFGPDSRLAAWESVNR